MRVAPLLVASGLCAAVAASAINTTPAYSCLVPPPPIEAADQADLVAVVKVDDIRYPSDSAKKIGMEITFSTRVILRLKGPSAQPSRLRTPPGYLAGYPFEVGTEYLIYAGVGQDGTYWTNACSRTRPAASAQEEIKELRAFYRVEETTPSN